MVGVTVLLAILPNAIEVVRATLVIVTFQKLNGLQTLLREIERERVHVHALHADGTYCRCK